MPFAHETSSRIPYSSRGVGRIARETAVSAGGSVLRYFACLLIIFHRVTWRKTTAAILRTSSIPFRNTFWEIRLLCFVLRGQIPDPCSFRAQKAYRKPISIAI